MFTVFLTNFGHSIGTATTLEAAIAKAKSVCFECTILREGVTVAVWTPLGGYHTL